MLGLHRELLKQDFATELNNASRPRAGDLAEVNIPEARVHSALAWAARGLRGWVDAILRVVKRVEGFDPELETDPFGELEGLAQPNIPVVDSGLGEYVARRVAIYTEGQTQRY